MLLSVIIPSFKDPLLHKTIDSLLENSELGDQIEIIPVLDGYFPTTPIREDKRIKILHLGKNRGMRGAINAGVSIAKGEFIARTDEHCVFGKGFDRILTESCQPNWICTAKRLFLDPVKWEVMDLPPVEYEKLAIQSVGKGKKFCGIPVERPDRKDVMVDETQAMQGSFWLMPRKLWNDVIGDLNTERYGNLLQDSHEISFKVWKAGGKLMVDKGAWFAHKHVSFPRTHNSSYLDHLEGINNMMQDWREYYEEIKKTFTY